MGDGPERARLQRDCPPNVELLGYRSDTDVRALLQRAAAFVFAAEDDFGIAPVEAQAAGAPVIAFARGGACETVAGLDSARPTGVFFNEESPAALQAAIRVFTENSREFSAAACRENAARFRPARFRREFAAFLNDHLHA